MVSRALSARVLVVAAAAVLTAFRLPSLVQPMGADQGLYAYVADRILEGDIPYVDAWDQKPPAIHYTYALMRAIWASDAVVGAMDLAAAVGAAFLIAAIARELVSSAVGAAGALLFLLLSNPAFTRLGGVRVRAQCETFIAVLVAAGVLLLVRCVRGRSRGTIGFALTGILLGAAFAFKYNAAVYAAAALPAILMPIDGRRQDVWRRIGAFVLGFGIVPLAFLVILASAWRPLYDATITYNLHYSGQTYSGPLHVVQYLLTFPVERARDDALWTFGGAGCAVLLASGWKERARLVPVLWVGAACLSIAINGSRGLPQYFVQAAPALALAAAWGGWILIHWARRALSPRAGTAAIAAGAVLAGTAVWRVNQFPKLFESTAFDAAYAMGRMPRDAYLGRYADERKYSALGAAEVAGVMREHSRPDEAVYLFGFTGAAYVYAGRQSASRFFWSRPVIAGFKEGTPGYGPEGLLSDLQRTPPAVVVLQQHDWAPDVDDSAHYFMNTPPLAAWLRAGYDRAPGPEGFDVWLRRR